MKRLDQKLGDDLLSVFGIKYALDFCDRCKFCNRF